MRKFILAVILILAVSSMAFAHPGKLDANGGHYDKDGNYHYHKGPNAAESMELRRNQIYKAEIIRVVDGDTAIVSFITEDGVKYKNERVRFLGVDTPETVHPNKPVQYYGKEASDFTKRELTGKTVWLQTDVNPYDRYNRMLAYVWLEEPSASDLDDEDAVRVKMYNAKLLLDGYAQAMTIQPNSRYSEVFVRFQREAREADRGLWAQE